MTVIDPATGQRFEIRKYGDPRSGIFVFSEWSTGVIEPGQVFIEEELHAEPDYGPVETDATQSFRKELRVKTMGQRAVSELPVPVVDLRNLRDDSLSPNYQPLLCDGLDAVIEVRNQTGVDVFPWIYEEVNPFE